jgi:hypothetical protein
MSKSSKNTTRVKNRNRNRKKNTRRVKKCVYTDEAKRIMKEIILIKKSNKANKL